MKRFALLIAMCGLLAGITGCKGAGALGIGQAPTAMPAELGSTVSTINDIVSKQGVMDKFSGALDGDVFNPGMELYMTTSIGTRFVGTRGEVNLSAEGTGTQLPPGANEAAVAIINDPRSTPQQLEWAYKTIEFNRLESPHNPVPAP